MQKQIIHIAPVQLGKIMALLYFFMSIPFAAIILLTSTLSPAASNPPLFMVFLMPILYVAMGFIFSVLGAWLYNVAAKWVGGITYTAVADDQSGAGSAN